jgi:homocysteine S-methyltransferase
VNYLAIPEGAAHIAHLPPLVQAQLCRQVGVATLIQYTCRGRRLTRIQSDLLGAYASGVTNLLLVTGDPLVPGVEPDAWPDLEIDSIGAVNLAAKLNHGEDLGGNPIGRPTAFHVGVHLDPTAHDLDRERSRFHWKVDAGAEFAITAPIFDLDALRDALAKVNPPGPGRIPVIGTLWPLTSARQAEFFEHQMASVPVPQPLVERMRAAEERGDEEATGLAIAVELARGLRPLVEGIQVVATDGRTDLALAVLAAL